MWHAKEIVRLERLPDPDRRFNLTLDFNDYDVDGDQFNNLSITGWGTFDGVPIKRASAVWGTDILVTTTCYADPEAIAFVNREYRAGFEYLGENAPIFFILRIPRLRLPRSGAVNLNIEVEDAAGGRWWWKAARITGPLASKIQRPASGPIPILMPLLGRSGSSLLMRCLAEHPDIVVIGEHPHELWQATYLWKAFDVLSAPADNEGSMKTIGLNDLAAPFIGQNPFASRPVQKTSGGPSLALWQSHEFPTSLASFIQEQTRTFVQRCAADQGKKKSKFFVEKMLPSLLIHTAYNLDDRTKFIFMVRDLRDIAVSMINFDVWKAQFEDGYDFNEREEWARDLVTYLNTLMDYYECYKGLSILVRYEKLVGDPEQTLKAVFRYLGVANDTRLVARIADTALRPTKLATAHMTSSSPAASIGRWKTELPPPIKSMFERLAGGALERSGYAV